MELLVELDGQHLDFSESELLVLLRRHFPTHVLLGRETRFLHVEVSRDEEGFCSLEKLAEITGRMALGHAIMLLFFHTGREDFLRSLADEEARGIGGGGHHLWNGFELLPAVRENERFTFGVSCNFICSKDARRELYPHEYLVGIIKKRLGDSIIRQSRGKARVELSHPDVVLTVQLGSRVYMGIRFPCPQRRQFEEREVANRPFFSPISVEPKWARASLNLLGLPEGSSVYDPFCGTGGILIEAGLLGHRILGSDMDERMVEGSAMNLRHYGVADFEIFQADVGAAKEELLRRGLEVDAVVSDFPYGKASTLGKEDRGALYDRAFSTISAILREGSLALFVLPSKEDVQQASEHGLRLENCFPVYIHGTLTRFFSLYRRI